MSIFKINSNKLEFVTEIKIDLEKDIQKLTEQNLKNVFGLEFICSEFQLNGLRIDTLAFDHETSSFVIIEYKKDRSFSVIDQGFAYLGLMVNNKADFIIEYAKKHKNIDLNSIAIDWSQSRIIFIANSFTNYQQSAMAFKDLSFELWEVKKFDNNLISYSQLKPVNSTESIKSISKNSAIEKVSSEVKKYTIDDLFKENWTESKEIFDSLVERILVIDPSLEIKPTKYYIAVQKNGKNMIGINIYKSGLSITFTRSKPEDFNDPEKKAIYIKDSFKRFNQHQSLFQLTSMDDLDYATMLLKQAHKRFIGKD